ncbi:MAG TPA: hypothetical protein PLY93_13130 [Turneriella sp.]|nr:hypothetical protein [Turneriella sp.]
MTLASSITGALFIFQALHWFGVALYVGSLLFLLFIFQKVYQRYRAYKYVDNFRAEVITLYWRYLHIAFLVIISSGTALALAKGKSVIQGAYGMVFSAKLALWLVQIYFTQETLKPFVVDVESDEQPHTNTQPRVISPLFIFLLLMLISSAGFALKFL